MLHKLLGSILIPSISLASTLTVGPGKQYQYPTQAMKAAQNGDIIEVIGEYKGVEAQLLIDKDVTVRGGKYDCLDTGVFSIGCWVVNTNVNNVTVENVEITNFNTPPSASCIRVNTPGKFTLKNSYLHHCQQLLLSSNQGTQEFFLSNNTFTHGGIPGGQTHNVYIGDSKSLIFINNRSHNSNGGSLVKTRADINVIVNNDIGDPLAIPGSNYELDISCGGTAYIVGNKIFQGRNTANQRVIFFGPESCQTGEQSLTVVGNIFTNEASGSDPVFIQVRKQSNTSFTTLRIENNLFTGQGAMFRAHDSNITTDTSTNVQLVLPLPPIAYVSYPEDVKHSLRTNGVELYWTLPPGATGAVVRRDGVVIPSTATSAKDTAPLPRGTSINYTISSLQGTAESVSTPYTVRIPLLMPETPTEASFTEGWYEVPTSQYQLVYGSVVPFLSKNIVEAWSGLAYDATGNALYLFGGGGVDYTGTEVLKVPLQGSPSIVNPSTKAHDITAIPNPVESLSDGTPSWRHTYSGLVYAQGKLYVYGGLLPRNVAGTDLWSLSTNCPEWTKLNYTGDKPDASFGSVLLYDGKLMWLKTATGLFSYDPSTNVMTKRASINTGIYQSGVLANGHLYIATASDIYKIDLASSTVVSTYKHTFGAYTGIAYDTRNTRVVLWNGGNKVGIITDTNYSVKEILGSPGNATSTGTHSRLFYIPLWNIFGLQNLATQNVYLLKVN